MNHEQNIKKLRALFNNDPVKLELLNSMYNEIEKRYFPSILEIKPNSNVSITSLKKITKLLGYKLIIRKDENRFFLIKKND